jgi:hypothetical protein
VPIVKKLSILALGIAGVFASPFGCSDSDEPTKTVLPKTIRVASDGTGDAPTIQAAIDAARDGDVIELENGVYTDDGNRDVDFRGKAIIVRSRNTIPDSCTIQCSPFFSHWHRAFIFQTGETSEAIIEGLKIINGTGGGLPGSLDASTADAPTGATYGGALLCTDGATPTIRNCIFVNNYATEGSIVLCLGQASPRFVNCTLCENSGDYGALFAGWEASVVLEQSLMAFNSTFVINPYHESFGVVVTCCDCYGNWLDWTEDMAPLLGIDGNISKDPLFADREGGDFSLLPGSPCLPDSSSCGLIGTDIGN